MNDPWGDFHHAWERLGYWTVCASIAVILVGGAMLILRELLGG